MCVGGFAVCFVLFFIMKHLEGMEIYIFLEMLDEISNPPRGDFHFDGKFEKTKKAS